MSPTAMTTAVCPVSGLTGGAGAVGGGVLGGGLGDPPDGGVDGAVGPDEDPPQATAVARTAHTSNIRGEGRTEELKIIVAPNRVVELDKKLHRRHGYNMAACAPA
jgi:hypothetical protein